jgi:uncharacterized small protein (DUF1192 family)
MEALDRLEARKALRLDPQQVLKPAEVRNFDDIKRLVAELDPKKNPRQMDIPLSTTMVATEDNQNVTYRVEAHTRSKSKRDMLVEGLDVIKIRMESAARIAELQEEIEVNGVPMKPARLGYQSEGTSWVDPLIKQWLGGFRDGIMICWRLADGYTYRYDIYQHKLTRVPTQS